MDLLNTIQSKARGFFEKYSAKQRLIMALSATGFVLLVAVLILQLTKPEYITLYRDLDLETTAKITKALEDMKIPYRLDSERSVSVPKQYVNKAKLDLVGAGLPDAKFDYQDLIDRNSMFLSETEKNQARNYALQNEISKVLESIPGVERAFVNLAIPENKDFILQENRLDAKASVMLKFAGDFQADPKDIEGIAMLVASSVEGLSPDNVTIHSASGQVLNRKKNETEDDVYLSATNMELQRKAKEDIENSLNNFLAPIFGYGNTSVMASVKLNFDGDSTQSKLFNPPVEGETEGLIRSLHEGIEQVENKPPAIGDPGVEANAEENGNVVDYATVDEKGNSNYNKSEKIINYELNEIVRNVEKAKGQIESLTVAVVINQDILQGGELSDDMRESISAYITAATGLDTKSVEVYAQPFNQDIAKALESSAETGQRIPLWMWIALGFIVLIPIILLALYFVLSARKKKREEEEKRVQIEKQELLESQSRLSEEEENIEFEIKESGRKKSIESLIEKNPEIVTQLLKSWIDEE